jgi:UDP-GlcNAc:undecaprenyl-phosphate GlcNAc-1-phosphate transferase
MSFGLVFAFVLTPLSRRLALRIGAVDNPGERRIHVVATPRLGGPAILGAMVLALLLVSLLDRGIGAMMRSQWRSLFALAFGAFIVMMVGAIDDVRPQRPLTKLAVETCAAAIVVCGGWSYHPGLTSLPLSIFFIVASTNAINLVDGLDGLAAGLSLMISVTLLLLSQGRTSALMLFALSGSLIGFVPYNLHPAKIFLGDSGALLLGFVIGVGALSTSHEMGGVGALPATILAPIFALGLPLIELTLTTTRRILRARPIFGADRDHIHHRLIGFGFSQRGAVLLLYGLGALFCGVALAISRLESDLTIALLAVVVVACVAGVQWLGYLELMPIRSRHRLPLFEFPAMSAEIVLAAADTASANDVSRSASEP